MKKLLYGLAALLLLILLALVVLTQVVDTERVKKLLVEETREKTGRTLVINGDLSWRFFPSIGFTVTDAALLNPPGFDEGNTLSVGEISLDVALKPLFKHRLEIGEAVLGNARLHFITRADGVTNLDDLQQLSSRAPQEPAVGTAAEQPTTEPDNESPSRESMSITLAGVRVVDAEVVIQNKMTSKLLRLTKVNFKLDNFAPGQTVPLSLSGNLFSDDIQANLSARGQFWLAPEFNQLTLSDVELELAATGRAIPGNKQLQLQGQLAYNLDKKQADFSDIQLTLDELNVAGDISVNHQALPNIAFELHTDLLDIDALQAGWQSGATLATTTSSKQGAANESAAIPDTLANAKSSSEPSVSVLQGFNLQGTLSADKVLVEGIELEALDIQIKSKQGKVELNPVRAQLYEGKIAANADIDLTKQPITFRAKQSLTGVNARALLTTAADLDYIDGRADLALDIKGSGISAQQLKKNITGNASIAVADGALHGINIANLIRRAHAKIKGLPVPAKDDVEKTDFTALTADFTIGKGIVSTQNLHMASPLLRIDGNGETNLLNESLDVLFNTAIVGSIKGQNGEEITELKNIILPIRISGSYLEPKYQLDLQQVFDMYLKEKTDKEVERAKRKLGDKLGEKLGDKLGDKLPGLFDKLGL